MITRVPPGTWETLSFPSSKAAGDTAYQLPIDPRLRVRGRGGRTTRGNPVSVHLFSRNPVSVHLFGQE